MPAVADQWEVIKSEPLPIAQRTGDPWSVVKSEPVQSAAPQNKVEQKPVATIPQKPAASWDVVNHAPVGDAFRAAPPQTAWQKIKSAVKDSSQGRVVESNLAEFGRMYRSAKEKLSNPFGGTDQEWADLQKRQKEFNEKHLGKGTFKAGAVTGAEEFGEELMSPPQLALLAGTFGESALVQGAKALGIDGLVPAAKTLSKLIQAQFVSQMIEGAATGTEQAVKAGVNGDWESAGQASVEALASGLMAKGLISHAEATTRVRADLDAVAREKYGQPETDGKFKSLKSTLTSRFDQLNPFQQGLVIDETVKRSPEYQAVIASVDKQNEEASEKTKKQQAKKLDAYYGHATAQSWDENVAKRTIRKLQAGRQRGAQMAYESSVQDAMRSLREAQERQRTEAREARVVRGKGAAAERSEVGRIAGSIADQRDQVWAQRTTAQQAQRADDVPKREIESVPDNTGKPTYPAVFWGEQNTFGVASDVAGHAVYRQTPRGVEWLDTNGNFTENVDNLYSNPDPETADTLARLSSISATADTVAEEETSTPEQKKDAEDIAAIRRDLVTGEIDAKEAQRRAGIAEKATLPDEYTAAMDGRLNGPFHESSTTEYYDNLKTEAQESGLSEEETQAILDDGGLLARQQTESNLHHVYRAGDYITSKKGVKWTLDSKGMLHPDDGGQAVPLMKRGLYSNDAVQLAQSGRVGYGTETREERRKREGNNRKALEDIKAHQEEVDREMRLATQLEGLQPISEGQERADAAQKAQRQARLLSRPPRAAESQVGQLVRMVMKAPTGLDNPVQLIANRSGIPVEEVMRLALSQDPNADPIRRDIAGLELGSTISDWSRPDRPWKVEEAKGGGLQLRSGNANPLPLDRLNPSDRVVDLVKRGKITNENPLALPDEDQTRAAEIPQYVRDQEEMAEEVKDRAEGKVADPEPKTEKEAEAQVKAAEERSTAAYGVAIRAIEDVHTPRTDNVEDAEAKATKAEAAIKNAEEARAQSIEAKRKTAPKGEAPKRAPVSIGLIGNSGVIEQNNRQFPYRHELIPIDAAVLSHIWDGDHLVENPEFFKPLQPRDPEPGRELQRRLDGQEFAVGEDGKTTGYNFAKYANPTIDALSGTPYLDPGGLVISGSGRLQRLLMYLKTLERISDPDEREVKEALLKDNMRKLAASNGITNYPDDGEFYIDVRMRDKPIETEAEARELGLFFNVGENESISEGAKGIVYGSTLTDDDIKKIGRFAEDAEGGLEAAMRENPDYFVQLVADKFGIPDSQKSEWFTVDRLNQKILTDAGARQFRRAVKGYVLKDASAMPEEGSTADRAFERSLGYIVQMKAFPELDITGKITEALSASKFTENADPGLVASGDRWAATYRPKQIDLLGMERKLPDEPDRVVETLWRALHASTAAMPRTFSDRLKRLLSDETVQGGFFGKKETPVEKFNRVFSKEMSEVAFNHGDKTRGISDDEFALSLKNREMSDVERDEAEDSQEGGKPKLTEEGAVAPPSPTERQLDNMQGFARDLQKITKEARERQARFLKAKGMTQEQANALNEADKNKLAEEYKNWEDTGAKLGPPPKVSKEAVAERNLGIAKAENGYVTPEKLKTFLEANPATRDHVPELLRTARMMAEYVYEADKPIGVDKKDALDWILKARLAGIENGELKSRRGEYSDPNVEKGFGTGIMKLHEAAMPDTFLHEFAHVIFPMLSDEDLKAIDTIRGEKGHVWDGTRKGLTKDAYKALSEKFAHGLEQFLRDENPTGFTAEVKAVLAKVKEMMRNVYLKFKGDPLSKFVNTDESKLVFANMFGVTDFDVADKWHEVVAEARAEEKRLKKPSEEPHPLVKAAQDAGATSVKDAFRGSVEDSFGGRVDPRKPVAVIAFTDEGAASKAAAYYSTLATENKIDSAELIHNPEDDSWGVRFNTKTRVPPDILTQRLPEMEEEIPHHVYISKAYFPKEIHPKERIGKEDFEQWIIPATSRTEAAQKAWEQHGERLKALMSPHESSLPQKVSLYVSSPKAGTGGYAGRLAPIQVEPYDPSILHQEAHQLTLAARYENAKRDLAKTPESLPALRNLRLRLLQNLESEIRAAYNAETEPPVNDPELPKQVIQEVKNARPSDEVRKGIDGVPRLQDAKGVGGISKPPTTKHRNATTGAGLLGRPGVGSVTDLANVKPVALQPLGTVRGQSVGTVVGEAFDPKGWVESLKKGGLPENAPPPTWALSRQTADKLIFPGQKQNAQIMLSALEQGDGAVLAAPAGSGKTYLLSSIAKEWRGRNPDAKILVITKNMRLLKKFQSVAANSFGFDIEDKIPDPKVIEVDKQGKQTIGTKPGVYGGTYQKIIKDASFKNNKWDLVLADESGEARRWYDENTQQGKALMDVIANSKKAVYSSATPFHAPSEYGYMEKLNLWPKGQFDKWIENNFAHEKIDGRIIAKLDPAKQAKLRQQLIERGQLVSQAISYEGYNAHFGVVPVTDAMKRGLDRIHEGFARAKKQLADMGKPGLAQKISAFEATYTKAFLEREILPQNIELAKKALAQGYQVLIFSETTAEDLFRREQEDEMSTYQQLDAVMGGQLSRIIPPFENIYDRLKAEFGDQIGDFSGRGNSPAEREKAYSDFLAGEIPMLYSTYAAGGIGTDFHDADYPDRGIKGGDKPRVIIHTGVPYSGVLLEQAMGRPWRFGVKSDVHAVFLTTDAEPDIRLMQQKVGPRMRALRASVHGERDSLASAMSTYTNDEKVQARQEALAYQEGNEVPVTASRYQVRSKARNVAINDWSLINFPSADEAKNKGMKYGEAVAGGDWSTLYQDAAKAWMQPPDSPENIAGDSVIDAVGNGVSSGVGLPPEVPLQNLEPADRDVVVGTASAVAADAVGVPVERNKRATARQAMQSQMNLPGDKNKWILTFPNGKKVGVWRYTGEASDLAGGSPAVDLPKDLRAWYGGGLWTQEVGIRSIARQAGAAAAGDNIVRMNRSYQADADTHFASFALELHKIAEDNKINVKDPRVMNEIWNVKEGKAVSDNPAINKAVEQLTAWFDRIHDAQAAADVKLKTPAGDYLSWKKISKDPNYMPHNIDWDAQVEDPEDGKVYTLRDVMKETFADAKRRRIIAAISKDRNISYDQVVDYLKKYAPNTPVLGHIHRARTMDFPFIKKDWKTLNAYARQAADAIAVEKNFGHDRGKLEKEIERIPSQNGRTTIKRMFDSILEPQDWESWRSLVSDIREDFAASKGFKAKTASLLGSAGRAALSGPSYNAAIAYEAGSKMTISVTKLFTHAVHVPLGLKGRIRPFVKGGINLILHPKATLENAEYVGTLARQLNAADVITPGDSQGATHQIFGKTGFNTVYKFVRALSGESARIWMEQYALHELRNGNAPEARRLLRDVMLVGDKGIDQAILTGRFTPEDLAKGQTAFANMVAWSNNPLQMPGWARLHIERGESTSTVGLKRAVRLTYALQSYSLKSMSVLRESLWDEVMIHGNLKPLVYVMVAAPIAGQILQASTAGTKHLVHRGIEGLTGKPRTDKDAWDTYIESLEQGTGSTKAMLMDLYGENWQQEGKDAAKALKFYIDSITFAYGMDMIRTIYEPMMNLATGNFKKAGQGFKYAGEDVLGHLAGPAWGDLWKTVVETPSEIGQIVSGRGHPFQKKKKIEKVAESYVTGQVTILKQFPALNPPPKKSAMK